MRADLHPNTARGRSAFPSQPGPCLSAHPSKGHGHRELYYRCPAPASAGARRCPHPRDLRRVLRPRRHPLRPAHLPLPLGTRAPGDRPAAARPRAASRRPAARRPDPVAQGPARRLPVPPRPGPPQAAGHPRPAHRDRRRAARPPHLPRLRAGKAVLHPAVNAATATTARAGDHHDHPPPRTRIRCQEVPDNREGAGRSSRTTSTRPSPGASSAPTAAASRLATSTPSAT